MNLNENMSLDIKLTKEDILEALVYKKQEEIIKEINSIKTNKYSFDNEFNRISISYDPITEHIGIINDIEEYLKNNNLLDKISAKEFFNFYIKDELHTKSKVIELYDIERLEKSKRPSLIRKKQKNMYIYYIDINSTISNASDEITIHLTKEYEDEEGYSGELYKTLRCKGMINLLKKITKIIQNLLDHDIKNIKKINELEYELIIISDERTSKNKLFKKLLAEEDEHSILRKLLK